MHSVSGGELNTIVNGLTEYTGPESIWRVKAKKE